MSAHFIVRAEPARDLIRIEMAGFFTPADIQAFYDARAVEHAMLKCGRNQHLTLNDLRKMKVQSQEAVAAFKDLLGDPAYRSRKLAFVVDRTLARSQLMRALNGRDAKCFEDKAAAEQWLFAADPRAIAA
ncbi:MAG: STAS/SEC14 domain-containing protein [Proteobacteria bacterium]|nr:STAS/SEC14 domain-containing protein [Pseudomonadota bacterium]